MMTNSEFAAAVGCDVTTASRYRNGHRLPGVRLLKEIRTVLDMTPEEIEAVYDQGAEAFGAMLRERVFDDDGQAAVA